MEQLLPESWVYMHFTLILVITCAQMLVIYILGDSSNPPVGLGMYTVYFMAALLGWIAFTLQRGSASTMTVDVPSVAIIINSYILFLASGQRSGRSAPKTNSRLNSRAKRRVSSRARRSLRVR